MTDIREQFLKEQSIIENTVNHGVTFIGDSATATNDGTLGYLVNALEFIDPIVHKPLKAFHWFRDLPYIMAGGAIELASFYKTNYSFDESAPIASGSNNVIITVGTQYEKVSTRVNAYSLILKVGIIDMMKADKMTLNIYDDLEEGIMMKYNTLLDNISFFGLPGYNDSYGLFNNPNVVTETETTTAWEDQDGVALFNKFNDLVLDVIEDCDYDGRFTPNRILVPLSLFTKLSAPLQIVGGSSTATTGISLYKYLKENLASNIAGYEGGIDIFPNKYLASIGTNNTGRIVIYRYDDALVRGVMGMELTRGATVLDPSAQAYKTSFVSFIGEPQFVRTTPIRYWDNKAE